MPRQGRPTRRSPCSSALSTGRRPLRRSSRHCASACCSRMRRSTPALSHLRRGRELLGADLSANVDAKFSLEETRALLALGRLKDAATSAADALEKIDALDAGDRGRGYLLLGKVFEASGNRQRALGL